MKSRVPTTDAANHLVSSHLAPGEEVLICAASDLSSDGSFGRQSIFVTRERVFIVSDAGSITDISLGAIVSARAHTLVGGGCLEVRCMHTPPIRISYSASLLFRFSDVARGIERLRQGETLLISRELEHV